jgi:hypothetical protein
MMLSCVDAAVQTLVKSFEVTELPGEASSFYADVLYTNVVLHTMHLWRMTVYLSPCHGPSSDASAVLYMPSSCRYSQHYLPWMRVFRAPGVDSLTIVHMMATGVVRVCAAASLLCLQCALPSLWRASSGWCAAQTTCSCVCTTTTPWTRSRPSRRTRTTSGQQ